MNEPLTTTTDIDDAMTATGTFQVVADRIEVAVHRTKLAEAVPEDAQAGLTDSLRSIADIVGA